MVTVQVHMYSSLVVYNLRGNEALQFLVHGARASRSLLQSPWLHGLQADACSGAACTRERGWLHTAESDV